MVAEEIVKVTSKGQLTIPSDIREELGLREGSHVYMKTLGRLVVMRRVDELNVDEISKVLEAVAKDKGVTRPILFKEIEKVRGRLWKTRYGKAKSPP